MKFFLNIFLIVFILFISGCSSKKLTIKALYPSKIENEKIYTIRVERFYRDDVNQTVALANKIANKIIDNKKIFQLRDSDFGTDAILSGEVLNSSLDTQVYYRTEIDYSRCRFYRYDEKNRTRECIEYHIRHIPCEKREYNVTTNIKLIKPITNIVIFSKTYDKSSFDNMCFDHRPYYPIYADSRDKFRVNSQIADDIANNILDDISPHYVYYDIEIIEELDKDTLVFSKEQEKRFERIVELIVNRNLNLARTELEKLDAEFNGKSFEVVYNLALINEAYNQLQIANQLYNEAKALTLDIKYLDLANYGISRTSRNLEEKIKAKSQLP
ncbi:MAG: hypothetical protein PHG81_10040 [Aliarcobacter sp.]|nr:hypothetical protein [Aliarcobacter sp.]